MDENHRNSSSGTHFLKQYLTADPKGPPVVGRSVAWSPPSFTLLSISFLQFLSISVVSAELSHFCGRERQQQISRFAIRKLGFITFMQAKHRHPLYKRRQTTTNDDRRGGQFPTIHSRLLQFFRLSFTIFY